MRLLLMIGRLKVLEVFDPETRAIISGTAIKRWLAWDVHHQKFHICTVRGRVPARAYGRHAQDVVRAHERFHRVPPTRTAFRANAPAPRYPFKDRGLLLALEYSVPGVILSPGKNRIQWNHQFGDTGHKGAHLVYPEYVMPALKEDQNGNLFIVRRPGNIFSVDSWLRG